MPLVAHYFAERAMSLVELVFIAVKSGRYEDIRPADDAEFEQLIADAIKANIANKRATWFHEKSPGTYVLAPLGQEAATHLVRFSN